MTKRILVLTCIATCIVGLTMGAARAAQSAHGKVHSRYAVDLAKRIVPTRDPDEPVIFSSATGADSNHPRAIRLRFQNVSPKAVAEFRWQWVWDGGRCPALVGIAGAASSYTGAQIEAGSEVDVFVSPEIVRDLLRTTRKRCHPGPSIHIEIVSVRFADGTDWKRGTSSAAPR